MLRTLSRDLGYNNRLLMLSLFVWALGEGLWINLRQLYLAQLGANPVQIGTALAIEAFSRVVILIPAGYLADRLGPYKLVIASSIMGIIGPVLMLLAPTWQWAVPGMTFYSMSAFALPSISALALLSIPDKTTPLINEKTVAAIFAAYAAGLIISPAIGGEIAEYWGIHTCLWIGAAFYVLSLIVLFFPHHVELQEHERHEEHPRELLGNRRFLTLVLYYGSAALVFMTGWHLAPNFYNQVRQFPLQLIGWLFSAFSLGTVVFNLVAGRVSRNWNYALMLGIIWLAMLGALQSTTLPPALISFAGLGAIWSARAMATSGISTVVKPQNHALAFSALDTMTALASSGAAQIAGQLFAIQPGLPFVASLIGLPVMIVLWLGMRSVQHGKAATTKTILIPPVHGD